MLKNILYYIIAALVTISMGLTLYTYYKYNTTLKDPLIRQISKNIVVELPDHYNYSVDDAYLSSFILKTGVFALDTQITLDGLYHKDWLPLAFNYCSLLKKDAFELDNDFDNDNIPDFKDKFPYDYSNGDYTIRKSNTLDFDRDGIVNIHDSDADGNEVDDIFQGICMDRVSNSEAIKKVYPKKMEDKFLHNREDILYNIRSSIDDFMQVHKIQSPFNTDEQYTIFLESVFTKLLYNDSTVIEFGDKSLILRKKELLDLFNIPEEELY